MKRQIGMVAAMGLFCCVGAECPNNNNGNNNNNNNNSNNNTNIRVGLNVVFLSTETTTQRGPAVGDGVIAFNAAGNAILAWIRAGETQPQEVPAPSGMDNDSEAFEFSGKKLVVRDRGSGSLYVFDTATEDVEPISSSSINMGGSIGSNLWEVDGNLIATVNSTVTTTDGDGLRIKIVDISNINAYVITPFTVDPGTGNPSGIDIDAENNRVIVRTDDTFYLYDINDPDTAPEEFQRGVLQGGTGSADIQIQGDFVVFFDDDENFTVLNLTNGQFSQPNRNPARSNRGVSFEEDRFAFFSMENDDDGSSISVLNRCLVGSPSALSNLVDPAGTFVNGEDATDGRFGFGSIVDISPDAKWVFVSGETIVDVSEQERLFLSEDGGDFRPCVDIADIDEVDLKVLRASGAHCSNNLVAWNYPIDPDVTFSAVGVAYAVLPPP